MPNLFLNAARKKYRYPYSGQLMTEDLFDLDQRQLDQIYRELSKQLRKNLEDTLLKTGDMDDADIELNERVKIVKYIFQYKQDMAKRAEKAAETRARNQRIMELIQQKEDGELAGKSIEELRELLNKESE